MKTFGEQLERSLVGTITQLLETDEHEKHPAHKTLTDHGYKHVKAFDAFGIKSHRYIKPDTDNAITIHGDKYVHTGRDNQHNKNIDPENRRTAGSQSIDDIKHLSSYLKKYHASHP